MGHSIKTFILIFSGVFMFLGAVFFFTLFYSENPSFSAAALIIAGAILAVVLLSILIDKKITRPISEIAESIRTTGRFGLKAKSLPVNTWPQEINMLREAVEIMREDLKNIFAREAALSSTKSEFISIAAHRLRSPLSSVKWVLRIAIDEDLGPLTTKQKEYLERGYQANERMIRLIDDLLMVVRVGEGRFGYEFLYADLMAIIEEAILWHKQSAEKKGIAIIWQRPEFEIPPIKLDFQKIKFVLLHLLDNAILYHTAGGKVEVSIQTHNIQYLEIIVKDTGIGIPKDKMPQLFTKFFRDRLATKIYTEGSGISLYIVKNIIINHGGSVWAESEEGRGSSFHFTLPLDAKLLPKEEIPSEEFLRET